MDEASSRAVLVVTCEVLSLAPPTAVERTVDLAVLRADRLTSAFVLTERSWIPIELIVLEAEEVTDILVGVSEEGREVV